MRYWGNHSKMDIIRERSNIRPLWTSVLNLGLAFTIVNLTHSYHIGETKFAIYGQLDKYSCTARPPLSVFLCRSGKKPWDNLPMHTYMSIQCLLSKKMDPNYRLVHAVGSILLGISYAHLLGKVCVRFCGDRIVVVVLLEYICKFH